MNSGFSVEDAKARLASQLSIEIKKERADYIIDNGGTKEETAIQVSDIYNLLAHTMQAIRESPL